jgi:hypothetical protein
MRAVRAGVGVVVLSLVTAAHAAAAEAPPARGGPAGDVVTEVRARYAADPNTLGRTDPNAVVVVPVVASRTAARAWDQPVAQPADGPMPPPGYAYGPPPGYAYGPAPMAALPDPCCLRCPRWTFAIGLWFWGIDGTVGDDGRVVSADSDWTDTIENIDKVEFAIDARLRVEWNRWTANLQLDGATLEDSATFRDAGTEVEASIGLWTLQGDVGYKVFGGYTGCDPCSPAVCAELYVGARLYWVGSDIDAIGPLGAVDSSMSWIDPLVGFRVHADVQRWRFGLEGDIGGFEVGSDLAWSLTGFVGFEISRTFGVVLGWRVLDVDYQDGSEIFDARLSGPFLAVTVTF